MNGWYVAYILAIAINSVATTSAGHGLKSPLHWVLFACVVLAYIAGCNR